MAFLGFLFAAVLFSVLATVALAALYLAIKHRRLSHLPGPPLSSFWLGHVPDLRARGGRPFFYHCYDCYGSVCVYWILHFGIVQVCDSTEARRLLLDTNLIVKYSAAYKAVGYVYGNRFLGSGLVTQLDHVKWEGQSKLFNHPFRRQSLYDLLGPFNDIVDGFLDRIRCFSSDGEEVAMRELFPQLAIDIISKVAFSFESNAIKEETPFRKALDDVLSGLSAYFQNPLSQYLPTHRALRRRVRDGCDVLRQIGRQCIVRRQKEIMEGKDYGKDILGYILMSAADDRDLTAEDLVDEFVTFFFAGHHTTGMTMAFALQEILVNAEVKKRVEKEVDEVLHGKARVFSSELSALSFLNCVLKETLRCHPPVPSISRSPVSDVTVCGHHIPAGVWLQINIDVIHNRSDYWSNPSNFDPDRFLTLSTEGPFPFLPFSSGPHICVGKVFAEMEMKLVLARLFHSFDIHLTKGQDTKGTDYEVTLRPKSHVYCTFKERQTCT